MLHFGQARVNDNIGEYEGEIPGDPPEAASGWILEDTTTVPALPPIEFELSNFTPGNAILCGVTSGIAPQGVTALNLRLFLGVNLGAAWSVLDSLISIPATGTSTTTALYSLLPAAGLVTAAPRFRLWYVSQVGGGDFTVFGASTNIWAAEINLPIVTALNTQPLLIPPPTS